MDVRVTGTFALILLLAPIASGHAQAPPPPVPGFVPPYEIMRTVRAAGFDPLAPPLREGTIYVLRATDFRGILMRVVVDARTGAIRDANRILPASGTYGPGYGQIGMAPGPYESPPDDMPPPYGRPRDASVPPPPFAASAAPVLPRPAVAPAVVAAPTPPLPRPRPAALAARQPGEDAKPEAASDPKPATATDTKPDGKPAVTTATTAAPIAPAAPAAPAAPPASAPAKPNKASSPLLINN